MGSKTAQFEDIYFNIYHRATKCIPNDAREDNYGKIHCFVKIIIHIACICWQEVCKAKNTMICKNQIEKSWFSKMQSKSGLWLATMP